MLKERTKEMRNKESENNDERKNERKRVRIIKKEREDEIRKTREK